MEVQHNKDYVFVESPSHDVTCIGINEGKYAGVVLKYGKVSIGEENEDGTLPFQFEYDIIENNGIPREEFGDDFFSLAGDILVDIIGTKEKDFATNDWENSVI